MSVQKRLFKSFAIISYFHHSASYIREARAGSTVLRPAKIRNYPDRNADLADLTDFREFFIFRASRGGG